MLSSPCVVGKPCSSSPNPFVWFRHPNVQFPPPLYLFTCPREQVTADISFLECPISPKQKDP